MEEIAVKVAELEQRCRSNTRRIEDLERGHEAINRLATAVEVMATKQENMGENVQKLTEKIESIEAEPGERWKIVVEKAITIIVAAVVGFALAKIGL